MRKLAATFALILLLGSVAHADSHCPKKSDGHDQSSQQWTDPPPPPPPSDDYFGVGDGMPCGMLAQADDDDAEDSMRDHDPRGMGRMHWRGMEHGRDRIETFRTVRLLELLKLGDDNEVKFLEIYREYRKDYRDLRGHRMALIDSLADGLRSKQVDDKQIVKMIKQADSLDEQGARMTDDFYSQVRPLLTEEQMGKLYVFQARFEAEVLERIAEFRRGHEGGMPRGSGMRRQHNHPNVPEDSLK